MRLPVEKEVGDLGSTEGPKQNVDDLRSPPANRLESLKGDLKGLFSIRVNDQWRIVFRWTSSGAEDVDVVDYHG